MKNPTDIRNDIAKANVVFLTDLTRAAALADARVKMYAGECRYLGLGFCLLSMPDDVPEDRHERYRAPAARRWSRNLDLYDLLFANDRALIVCHRIGQHALGMVLTQAWRANTVLLDYDMSDFANPSSGYPELESYFPGLSPDRLLATITREAAGSVACSKPLADMLSDHTPNVALIPTGFDPAHFPERAEKPPSAPVRLVWLGTIDTVEEAKEPLLAIECLGQLPAGQQAEIELHLIGKGALWDNMQKHTESAGFPVLFYTEPDEKELGKLLISMHIGLCLPSSTPLTAVRDGRGVVAMMMAGLAIVTLSEGEPGRMIKDGETGQTAETIDRFRDCVQKLLSDDAMRNRLGAKAAHQAHRDFAICIPESRLGVAITQALAGDCFVGGDPAKPHTHARDQRYDAWITPGSHPLLFAARRNVA